MYPNLVGLTSPTVKAGQLLIEINTYGNPYPYVNQKITSFISDYLTSVNRQDLIEEYELNPLKEFPTLWSGLRPTYRFELTPLAFSEIPNEQLIAESFIRIMEKLSDHQNFNSP